MRERYFMFGWVGVMVALGVLSTVVALPYRMTGKATILGNPIMTRTLAVLTMLLSLGWLLLRRHWTKQGVDSDWLHKITGIAIGVFGPGLLLLIAPR